MPAHKAVAVSTEHWLTPKDGAKLVGMSRADFERIARARGIESRPGLSVWDDHLWPRADVVKRFNIEPTA